MSKYRRNRDGRTFFFTLVTHERRPILTTALGRTALREAIRDVRRKFPFSITAIILLPDHLHAVWEMPRDDFDYSKRWRLIKRKFTTLWRSQGGAEGTINESRTKQNERGVWQRRFYEHTCRDETDLKRFIDYLHVNPLKHGLVSAVKDWPWSSFHRYVRLGEYTVDWGSANEWYGDEFRDVE